ncbi:MAG TPA: gliding motility-associated C-terminal domain-containing protein [Bacteroidales bacterium]|jgi:gliding motility-associated-like protein|nr:gliding motility-associated C-terminal domain-containing protein [Bacteroidales bacterium]
MKRLSIAIFLFLSFLSLQAQELTNAGREFWVTSSKNILSDVMPDSALIYIMGDTLCTGYIENPNTSFYQTFTVVPDSVLVIAIPKEDILCNVPEVSIDTTHPIESKGVYIKTEKNVYVYLQTNVTNTISEFNCTQTAKVPVLPSHIFSTDIKLKGFSDPFDYSVLRLLLIIATEDNTTLFVPEIHYTGSLITYPFTVTLQKGQVLVLPSHGFVYSDTTTLITTNCKKVVFYLSSDRNIYTQGEKFFRSIPDRNLCKGKDFLLVKYAYNNFYRGLAVLEYVVTGNYSFTLYRCNQYYDEPWTPDISVSNRLDVCQILPTCGCETAPPWIIDVPFAFIRLNVEKYINRRIYLSVNNTYTGSGIWLQRVSNEAIKYTNYNHILPTDRMVKKWLFPTTQRRIFQTPDTTYVDLVIFVKPEGIHTMYINHQLIPSTAFDTFPYTNGDYYYLQYSFFNESVPDFLILENENGFSATIDEFGYNLRPNSDGLLDFLYFHNNDSGYNYYESPVAYSNLSPVDSATVYRCVGDLLHLEVPHNPDSIAIDWIVDGTLYPNSPTVNLPLTTAGTLTVQLVLHYTCPDTTTTFVVVVPPPVIPFSTDTTLCQGTELSAETPDAIHYLWSTGDTTASIVIDTTGIYSVSVTNLGCTVSLNNINVELYPQSSVNLGNDSILCALATLLLNAEQPHPATYLWQDLSTNTTYLVDSEGDYWVIVTDECLQVSDTIYLGYLYPFEVDLGNDTTLCEGQHLLLSAETPYCTYLWQDGSTESTYLVRYAGVYQVLVSNLCFDETAEIEVFYQRCEQELYIPSSFTPNSDGLNDQFKPIFAYPDKIEEYTIYIYNRWGNLLFTSQNPEQGWTGEGCMNGVYTYVIFYKTEGKGGKVVNGTVTIY